MKRAVIRASLLSVLMAGVYAAAATQAQKPPTEKPQKIADGIWFEQHNDIGKFGSNISWIEFSDYVAVIDTAFPLGAEEAIRNIKATTNNKPIKYAIVTHYHGDHTLGSGVFAKEGTTIARMEYRTRPLAACPLLIRSSQPSTIRKTLRPCSMPIRRAPLRWPTIQLL